MKLSPKAQAAVDEIVRAVVNEDLSLLRWVETCRDTFGPKINCERNVFGDCDKCDGRARTDGVSVPPPETLSPADADGVDGEVKP